jgi:hypothetical protein
MHSSWTVLKAPPAGGAAVARPPFSGTLLASLRWRLYAADRADRAAGERGGRTGGRAAGGRLGGRGRAGGSGGRTSGAQRLSSGGAARSNTGRGRGAAQEPPAAADAASPAPPDAPRPPPSAVPAAAAWGAAGVQDPVDPPDVLLVPAGASQHLQAPSFDGPPPGLSPEDVSACWRGRGAAARR